MLHKNRLRNPLHTNLRDYTSIEDYFKQCDTDVRTSFRKCQNKGYEIKELTSIGAEESAQLYDIWTSSSTRQGRQINMVYEDLKLNLLPVNKDQWPVKEYSLPLVFYALYMDGVIVGYLELLFEGDYAIVHSTMGHKNYLKFGIMKTLFFEVIKLNWGKINRLIYGPEKSSSHFKNDLRINKIENNRANWIQ